MDASGRCPQTPAIDACHMISALVHASVVLRRRSLPAAHLCPKACAPSANLASFNRYGVRIPAIVISPYAKAAYVDHTKYETTSILATIAGQRK